MPNEDAHRLSIIIEAQNRAEAVLNQIPTGLAAIEQAVRQTGAAIVSALSGAVPVIDQLGEATARTAQTTAANADVIASSYRRMASEATASAQELETAHQRLWGFGTVAPTPSTRPTQTSLSGMIAAQQYINQLPTAIAPQAGYGQAAMDMDKAAKSAGGLTGALSRMGRVASQVNWMLRFGGLSYLIRGAVQATKELVSLGAEAEWANAKLEMLADVPLDQAFNTLRAETKGLATDLELASTSSRLMLMGLADNVEEAGQLARIATQLGEGSGAMQQMMLMLSNMSYRRADVFAMSIDRLRDKTNELRAAGMGVEQAFKQAFIALGEENIEKLGDRTEYATGKVERFNVAWANLRALVGQGIAQDVAPTAESLAGWLTGVAADKQRTNTYRAAIMAGSGGWDARSIAQQEAALKTLHHQYVMGRLSINAYMGTAEKLMAVMEYADYSGAEDALFELNMQLVAGDISASEYADTLWRLIYALERLAKQRRVTEQAAIPDEWMLPLGQRGGPPPRPILGPQPIPEDAADSWRQWFMATADSAEKLRFLQNELANTSPLMGEYYDIELEIIAVQEDMAGETESLAASLNDVAFGFMSAAEQADYYRRMIEAGTASTEELIDASYQLSRIESDRARERDAYATDLSEFFFQGALEEAEPAIAMKLIDAKIRLTAGTQDEIYWLGKKRDLLRQISGDTSDQFSDYRSDIDKAKKSWDSLLDTITKPTQVTALDVAQTQLGTYKDKWDEWIRNLRSAVTDPNTDWAPLLPEEVRAAGLGSPQQTAFMGEKEQLFYSYQFERAGVPPDYMEKMDKAVMESVQEEILARQAKEKALAHWREMAFGLYGTDATEADVARALGEPAYAAGLESSQQFAAGLGDGKTTGQSYAGALIEGVDSSDPGIAIAVLIRDEIMGQGDLFVTTGKSMGGWITEGMQSSLTPGVGYAIVMALWPAFAPLVQNMITGGQRP